MSLLGTYVQTVIHLGPGTDVMILKIFSPKNLAKTLELLLVFAKS
jgi:hypothetical protein